MRVRSTDTKILNNPDLLMCRARTPEAAAPLSAQRGVRGRVQLQEPAQEPPQADSWSWSAAGAGHSWGGDQLRGVQHPPARLQGDAGGAHQDQPHRLQRGKIFLVLRQFFYLILNIFCLTSNIFGLTSNIFLIILSGLH